MAKGKRKKQKLDFNSLTTPRFIYAFFIFSLIFFLSIAFSNYFYPNYLNNRIKRELPIEKIVNKTPKPWQARKEYPPDPNYTKGQSGPLTFEKINFADINKYMHLDITTLAGGSVEPLSCLMVKDNEFSTIMGAENRTSDQKVKNYIKQIQDHEFSDESVIIYEDGRKFVENKGEKSKHKISFTDICKLNNIYFFIFEAYGEKTHAGGGGSFPTHLAYSDGVGNLIIVEKLSRGTSGTHIKLPKPASVYEPEMTTHVAYFGCRKLYSANDLELMFSCGGGDGPASSIGMYVLNLANQQFSEKAYCRNNAADKFVTRCFDKNGKIYYEALNDLQY